MTRSQLKRQALREKKKEDLSGLLITISEPSGAASEAYRTLRMNLLYTQVDTPPKVIVITSSGSSEGKSTVCANLGVVLAQAGKKTLIVDCDLRKPIMHKIFGLDNPRGVADILVRESSLQKTCQKPLPGLPLSVVNAGSVPPNPAELLSSRRFSEFLSTVREEFEYVLVDSPPASLASDAAIISAQGDGVLLVLDAGQTRKQNVRRVVHNLRTVGANVLGTVMSNFKNSKDEQYQSILYQR